MDFFDSDRMRNFATDLFAEEERLREELMSFSPTTHTDAHDINTFLELELDASCNGQDLSEDNGQGLASVSPFQIEEGIRSPGGGLMHSHSENSMSSASSVDGSVGGHVHNFMDPFSPSMMDTPPLTPPDIKVDISGQPILLATTDAMGNANILAGN